MRNGTNALARQGDTIAHRSGPVLVAVTCIRPDAAYRVSICYGSTAQEIDELSQSYPTEQQARAVARSAALLFSSGAPVAQVLDDLAAIRAEAARRSALLLVDAAADANGRRASSTARYAAETALDAARDELLDPATRNARDARLAELREHMATALRIDDPAERTWREAERFLASLADNPDQPSLWDAA